MTQTTINNLFEKIRSICRECSFESIPQKFTSAENSETIQIYLKTLENIRLELVRHHKLQEQYVKLQKLLQKQQTQLRRRVGLENEMKLYIETLKAENEELQREKLQFLDNTKTYIKQLKRVNENLFAQLTAEMNKNKLANQEALEKSNKKLIKQKIAEIGKSANKNKVRREQSIKEIIKTQYIQRQKIHTETKKQRKIHHYKLHSSIMTDCDNDNHHLEQNLRTFQDYNANTGRNVKQQLTKGNSQLVSNQTLTNFFEQSKISSKKQEKQKLHKSPIRFEKKDFNKNRAQNLSRHLSRDRKHNRSVYSVLSAEQIQNQKEIF